MSRILHSEWHTTPPAGIEGIACQLADVPRDQRDNTNLLPSDTFFLGGGFASEGYGWKPSRDEAFVLKVCHTRDTPGAEQIPSLVANEKTIHDQIRLKGLNAPMPPLLGYLKFSEPKPQSAGPLACMVFPLRESFRAISSQQFRGLSQEVKERWVSELVQATLLFNECAVAIAGDVKIAEPTDFTTMKLELVQKASQRPDYISLAESAAKIIREREPDSEQILTHRDLNPGNIISNAATVEAASVGVLLIDPTIAKVVPSYPVSELVEAQDMWADAYKAATGVTIDRQLAAAYSLLNAAFVATKFLPHNGRDNPEKVRGHEQEMAICWAKLGLH